MNERNIDPSKALFIGDAMSDYEVAAENATNFIALVKNKKNNIFKKIPSMQIMEYLFGLGPYIEKGN